MSLFISICNKAFFSTTARDVLYVFCLNNFYDRGKTKNFSHYSRFDKNHYICIPNHTLVVFSVEVAQEGKKSIKVDLLANQIRTDMGEEETPLFICVLKGAFMFASDLLKAYKGSCELEFIRLSSYNGTKSLGKVKKLIGMDFKEVRERRVVIIEDIVDTGLTIRTLLDHL